MATLRDNKYFQIGLTVFCTAGAVLLFYDTLFGSRVLWGLGGRLLTAVQPILYGVFMAYLLAPVVNFFESRPHPEEQGKSRRAAGVRAVSILLTWAVIAVLVYLLASVLLPELYKSVLQLISNVENYYNTINGWVQHLLETNPTLEVWASQQMERYYTTLERWIQDDLLPQATTVMTVVSGGVFSAVGFFGDLLVGMIVSVYLLATKERCAAQARRLTYGLFTPRQVPWILRGARRVDEIFSGFVRGKLLDSLIIGVLCFLCCSLLKFPYTPLVSVIVGVTNVIPFFGPFLGAVPSTFLILLVSPMQALYFLLLILALQQLDGNVIGPKILGDKTGLSSLWVIIAILVGGSFFGIPGMFFGVPVCACLYSAVNFFIDVRLRSRSLPVDLASYQAASGGTDKPRDEAQDLPGDSRLP